MYKLSLYASIALIAFAISCKNEHTDEADSSSHQKHWSYEGETSPEHWAAIEKNPIVQGRNNHRSILLKSIQFLRKKESKTYRYSTQIRQF